MAKNLNFPIEQIEALANKERLNIYNEKEANKLLRLLINATRKTLSIPTFVYGKRLENIFFEMVKALKTVVLIKKENEEKYYSKEKLIIPDYKIVLDNGEQYFVEVKNFSPATTLKSKKTFQYALSKKYFSQLNAFSKVTGVSIKVAIFWRKARVWTLNELEEFKLKKGKYIINMIDAFQFNQMHELGDRSLATESPLVFRILLEPKKLDSKKSEQKVSSRITDIQLISTEGVITNKKIKTLAFTLFWFGEWKMGNGKPLIDEGNLIGWDYIAEPEEKVENQKIQIIAKLSTLYTNMSYFKTDSNTKLPKINFSEGFTQIDKIIPSNPFKKGLPLWIFTMKPKDKSTL